MQSIANIKSISYLKSHAAQISEDLEMNGIPFVITQNGEASMVIEGVKQFQEKEALIAALQSGKFDNPNMPIHLELSILPEWLSDTHSMHARIPISEINVCPE